MYISFFVWEQKTARLSPLEKWILNAESLVHQSYAW